MSKWFYIILLFTCCVAVSSSQTESDYTRRIQKHLGGRLEVPVSHGRVDLMTEDYAIEVELAPEWKESIGQALWYGLQSNKKPGIVIVMRQRSDYKYVQMLYSTLRYAGIQNSIKVWVWPIDFDDTTPVTTVPGYWLSKNSKVRHNSHCRWYQVSRGRPCSQAEGRPCGICGG